MRRPILHSDLYRKLKEVTVDGKKLPPSLAADLLDFTAGGVLAEGAKIPDDYVKPAIDGQTSMMKPSWTQPATPYNGFRFGAGSGKEMSGVDSRLIKVANLALYYTTQDFTFFDGLRTMKEQVELKRKGMTKTLQSKHLEGLAMDLVPYARGAPRWEWDLIYPVVLAVDRAATELNVAHLITWGGAWDRTLADFGGDADAYEKEVRLYCDRHPGKDFIDGPHFQIVGPKQ